MANCILKLIKRNWTFPKQPPWLSLILRIKETLWSLVVALLASPPRKPYVKQGTLEELLLFQLKRTFLTIEQSFLRRYSKRMSINYSTEAKNSLTPMELQFWTPLKSQKSILSEVSFKPAATSTFIMINSLSPVVPFHEEFQLKELTQVTCLLSGILRISLISRQVSKNQRNSLSLEHPS